MDVYDKLLDDIDLKYKKITFYKILNVFLASSLSIIGTVLILSFLMFLNKCFGVSYFACFILILILPSVYSCGVNFILNPVEIKIKDMKLEIKSLEEYIMQLDIFNKKNKLNDSKKDSLFERGDVIMENFDKEFINIDDEILLEQVEDVNSVEYVLNEINGWYFDVPKCIVTLILEDIRNNGELLKHYFPEVDFTKVSLDDVYDRLFNLEKDMKQSTGFSRKRS